MVIQCFSLDGGVLGKGKAEDGTVDMVIYSMGADAPKCCLVYQCSMEKMEKEEVRGVVGMLAGAWNVRKANYLDDTT